ncbi:MAG: PhnD/SsuA/transferrin family substrate-binding protein [Geminicoccaceae bacterium]
MLASLPMYDLPELRVTTDAWWLGVAQAAARHGVDPVPLRLDRTKPTASVWRLPSLLLSQCCGRDLVTHLAGQVEAVAISCYRASGCSAGTYRSWLVARRKDPRQRLEDFFGATAAINYTGSHSGWVALGHALVQAGLSGPFFARAVSTGGHRASLGAIVRGAADLAAIDCVTFALLERVAPAEIASLRIIAESEAAPALPYITAAGRPNDVRFQLFDALVEAASDEELAASRAALLLDGFLPVDGDPYTRSMVMAEEAAPALAGLTAVLGLRADAAAPTWTPASGRQRCGQR